MLSMVGFVVLTSGLSMPWLWGISRARTAAQAWILWLIQVIAWMLVGAASYFLPRSGILPGHEVPAVLAVMLLWLSLIISVLAGGIATILRVVWIRTKGR